MFSLRHPGLRDKIGSQLKTVISWRTLADIFSSSEGNEQQQAAAAMNDVLNLLEAEPSSAPAAVTAGGVVQTSTIPDIRALREQLAILVSTGKAKKAIGVQVTHEQGKQIKMLKSTIKGSSHS